MKALLFSSLLMATAAQAQLMVDQIPAADRKVTDAQADQIFKALRAVNFAAKDVVYPIYTGNERISYGISLGDERLLAKASELLAERALFTASREKEALAAKVIGIYPEEDLAVLSVPGLKAPAALWADADSLDEGAFLAAIRPDGEAQAMGVISVKERSLKMEDQGFLGIQMDQREAGEGVRIEMVVPESAAAEVGLRAGDVITKIDGEEVRGFYELSTRLRRLKNGEQPEIEFVRASDTIKVTPTLKGRMIDERQSPRLNQMDRMSGTQSRVRGEFSNVIQSDMALESSDAGLPVVDLEGRIVGMVIARAGRISTLILPGDDIDEVLRKEATPYVPAPRNPRWERRAARADHEQRPVARELDLMRRMMQNLQRQLDRE
jgi:S1-C subfamily serine protease